MSWAIINGQLVNGQPADPTLQMAREAMMTALPHLGEHNVPGHEWEECFYCCERVIGNEWLEDGDQQNEAGGIYG